MQHLRCDRTEQMTAKKTETVRRHHNQIRVPGSRRLSYCSGRIMICIRADAVRSEGLEIACKERVELRLRLGLVSLVRGMQQHDLRAKLGCESLYITSRTPASFGEIYGKQDLFYFRHMPVPLLTLESNYFVCRLSRCLVRLSIRTLPKS